eukprot:m.102292 g.102292  ORF g.102292 m.102292 type:complete len:55 (+) comp15009_c0_seq1:198-362(+)
MTERSGADVTDDTNDTTTHHHLLSAILYVGHPQHWGLVALCVFSDPFLDSLGQR